MQPHTHGLQVRLEVGRVVLPGLYTGSLACNKPVAYNVDFLLLSESDMFQTAFCSFINSLRFWIFLVLFRGKKNPATEHDIVI